MGNQQGNLLEMRLAWLGGFLDGEGSFIMLHHSQGQNGHQYSKQWRPAIKVAGTHVPTLNHLTAVLEDADLPYHVSWRYPKNQQWSASWMVEVVGLKRCLRWTTCLKGYLFTKAEDNDLMLEFCHTRLEQKPLWNIKDSAQDAKPQLTDRQLEIISRLRGRHGGVHLKRPSETEREPALIKG